MDITIDFLILYKKEMKKEFVPYELAVKLKALGFDEPCFKCKVIGQEHLDYTPSDYDDFPEQKEIEVLIPTFSQAFRWFKDLFNIEVTPIIVVQGNNKWYNISCILPDNNNRYEVIDLYEKYYSREEAELACLDKLIEIVKSK